jgi:Laminin G domain.
VVQDDLDGGGKLLGLGNSASGNSSSYDRHIYMSPEGRITFGVYPNAVRTVSSTEGYNDGQWHHVVATLSSQGMALYLDGRKVGEDTSTVSGQAFRGYWRIGGDTISGWPDAGSGTTFHGDLDDVAIYPGALTSVQVRDHYTKSGRSLDVSEPTDAYGKSVWQDEPTFFWRLDEMSGTSVADASGNAVTGDYSGAPTLGVDSPVAGTGNTAVTFDGSNDTASTARSFTNPGTFSLEAWFNTTSTSGARSSGSGTVGQGCPRATTDTSTWTRTVM